MAACGIAAGMALGLMALLITWDVVARNLGLGGVSWAVEASEYTLLAATWIAAPWVLHQGAHVRVEVLLQALPRGLAVFLEALADLTGLAVCAVLLRYGIAIVEDARAIGGLVIKSLVFPEWWILVPLPLAAVLLGIEFVRRLGLALRPET